MKYKISAAFVFILLVAILTALYMPRGRAAANYSAGEFTFILDAGHGGADGGAVAPDGTVESSLNLSICQKLDAILGLYGFSPILTRNSEEIEYPDSANTIHKKKVYDQKTRVELINSVKNGLLISIHLNKFPSSQPHGAQALYNGSLCSKELAECIQSLMLETLKDGNKRTATEIPDGVYLMKLSKCPSVLVECGFLSNPNELALLKTETYRTKLALIIASSCVRCSQKIKDQFDPS